jgi:hypothetical protein
LTYLPPNLPSHFLSRDAKEKNEEKKKKKKKKKKKRKVSQTTPGPDPATTTIPMAPSHAAEEEGGRASKATEPPSTGGRSETMEVAPATPAATSMTTAPGASSAMPATPANEEVANPTERAASEPLLEGETTAQGPGPSRAPSPPLPEILGRHPRITTCPHPTADEAWERVQETMIPTFHDEVTRARAAEIDEGWVLFHEVVERDRLLDVRAAAHREAALKEAEEIRASMTDEAEEVLARARMMAREILARAHVEAMEITAAAC